MNAIDLRNVTPLSDFRNHIKRYMEELSVSKKPLLLTQHGKSAAVLLDAEHYQKIIDQLSFMQAVVEGLEEYRRNRTVPVQEVFDEIYRIIGDTSGK